MDVEATDASVVEECICAWKLTLTQEKADTLLLVYSTFKRHMSHSALSVYGDSDESS
jgi:hypothetical protein